MTADADARGPLLELLDPTQRLLHLAFHPHDADERLHRVLEIRLHFVWVLARVPALEWRQRILKGLLRQPIVHASLTVFARPLGGVLTGALAEHDQIRERVAAQTIGAVDAG